MRWQFFSDQPKITLIIDIRIQKAKILMDIFHR